MKKNIIPFLVIISLIILSCKDNSTNPNGSIKNLSKSNPISLSKASISTSDIFTWDKTIEPDCQGLEVGFSNSSYSFSYLNYNFMLSYSRSLNSGCWNNSISVTVNNQYYTTITWSDPFGNWPSTGWVGWTSFNYSTSQISINVSRTNYPDYCGVVDGKTQPDLVQVQVPIYTIDPVSNFTASPSRHQNDNQDVTLTWTASSDTDVSGYEIYCNGSLLINITSRTTSQYLHTNIPWGYNFARAIYKIRAYDTNHNLISSYSECNSTHLLYAQ